MCIRMLLEWREEPKRQQTDLSEEDGQDGAEEDAHAVVEELVGVRKEEVAQEDEARVGEPAGGDAERGGDDLGGAVRFGLVGVDWDGPVGS